MQLRVLLQIRSDVSRYLGGEAIQVRETARALADLGVRCEISADLAPNLSEVDVVHIFGITQPTEALIQARHARRAGVPIVVSPVYQNLTEYDSVGRYGAAALAYRLPAAAIEQLKSSVHYVMSRWRGRRPLPWVASSRVEQQRELINLSRLLMPNSESEKRAIERDFRIEVSSVVVPNGISDRFACGDATTFIREHGKRDFVLAVGVITSLKNQLRLIEALAPTALELVLIGGRVTTHARYYRAVERAARRSARVMLLQPMSAEALADAYAAARVVALPSWFETCGMVGLEGVLAGCRVAVTDRGYTVDYFGQNVSYCNPGDVHSIKRAVEVAYAADPPRNLADRIRTSLTWTNAAARTLEGYKRALEQL